MGKSRQAEAQTIRVFVEMTEVVFADEFETKYVHMVAVKTPVEKFAVEPEPVGSAPTAAAAVVPAGSAEKAAAEIGRAHV